jgi:hypothetical protein
MYNACDLETDAAGWSNTLLTEIGRTRRIEQVAFLKFFASSKAFRLRAAIGKMLVGLLRAC